MHQIKTFVLLCTALLALAALPDRAPGQQHVPPANKIDSIGQPLPQPSTDSTGAVQDSARSVTARDSLRQASDSLNRAADSLKLAPDSLSLAPDSLGLVPDTLGRMKTPSLVGTLDRAMGPTQYLTRDDLRWMDIRYLGDVLETFPGLFLRDQAGIGQYNQVNVRGQDWRSVAVLQNGRLMNDPASGIYNLYQFSPEFANRVEVVTGPRAFLYGLNSSGGAVNLVTRNYNSNRPFTKLNYYEGAYEQTLSDGTFSQNVSRKVNLTLGYQYQGMGGRFLNSSHEGWNIRGKVRYNVSDDLNIILSEYYTSTYTNLNGGIDLAASRDPFDPRLAVPRNLDAYEKVTRHDMDLAVVGTLLEDTINVTTLNLYYSHNLREYRDEENRSAPNGVFIMSDHTSSWVGATLTQNLHTDWQRLDAGINMEVRQVEGSPNIGRRRNVIGSVWGKEELLLGKLLTVAGFGRLDRYLKDDYAGAGLDVTVYPMGVSSSGHPTSGGDASSTSSHPASAPDRRSSLSDQASPVWTLFGGYSFSRRVPNYMELFWKDSTVGRGPLVAETHHQFEVGTDLRWADGGLLRAAYFHRAIKSPILFVPSPVFFVFPSFNIVNVSGSLLTQGIEASLRLHLWKLYFEGSGTYLLQRWDNTFMDKTLPRLSLSGGIYFWSPLVQDRLELKAGFRGRYRSSQSGGFFNPEALAYVGNAGPEVGYASSVDFFLIGHLGDAYIHLMWENLLNIEYYGTPYYPGSDRAFRFGISWEFLN